MKTTVQLTDGKNIAPIISDDCWYNETSKCFHFRNRDGQLSMKTVCIIPRDRIVQMWFYYDE